MRDGLLALYRGQWVAIDQGHVVAGGVQLLDVMTEAATLARHPYVARVGMEEATVFRVRREESTYDMGYHPTALPRSTIKFFGNGRLVC